MTCRFKAHSPLSLDGDTSRAERAEISPAAHGRPLADAAVACLEERDRLYALFTEIVKQVSLDNDLDELIETVVALIGRGFGVSRSMIGLYPPDVESYSFQYIWHADGAPRFEAIVMPGYDHNPAFRMLLAGEIYSCCDTMADPRFLTMRDFYRRYQTRATTFVGLWRFGAWWGTIGVHQCDRPRQWTEEEVFFLQRIADAVALAIDFIRYRERASEQALHLDYNRAELHDLLVQVPPQHNRPQHSASTRLVKNSGVTQGEMRVLRFITQGMTNAEIATQLNLSRRTVESHITNMLGKLALRNRVELARFALGQKFF